ncbi:MAG: spheroidene monooxygenase [Sphingobacteriia bacterium]|nr:MAG: spheroidene monooxygenase [Sphingobacteriia bacterium]
MFVHLKITRYPAWLGWAGMLSMAIFRLPLWLNTQTKFWKLMGCGRKGSFDKTPDWRQWALLTASETPDYPWPGFLTAWWRFFGTESWTLTLVPIEGHGTWDGKKVFGDLPRKTEHQGPIAILTRASIRWQKLNRFWQHVDPVAQQMASAEGFVTSVGIGELPWIQQATFSIWRSKDDMKKFAYQMPQHADVVRKTHAENWYKEEMFVRFQLVKSQGSLRGILPFEIKP